MACPYEKTVNGFRSQFAVNHLGHFLFTNLLLEKMMASSGARIVNVTSNGSEFGGIRWEDPNFKVGGSYNKWAAYAQSKTANILFSAAFAERLDGKGVYTFIAEPGGIFTKFGKNITAEDFELLSQFPIPILSAADGTATQVAAALDPSLQASNGAFLENCKPSQMKEEWSWACSKENTDKLWALSEGLVGQKFDYLNLWRNDRLV